MRALIAFSLMFVLWACGLAAEESTRSASLAIEDAWAAPTPAGVDVSAGYLSIDNRTASSDRLLSATSPRAERVEVHEMRMDGAVMRMRPVQALAIPAGAEVQLAVGGAHLMFYGVRQPFNEGEEIPVELVFETAGAIDVVLPVRRSSPARHADH
jgi:copper(I)-binding protein